THPMVEGVRYAGLPASPYHDLARKYLPKGPGSVFAFEIKGGREAGKRLLEALRLWSHIANVGDTKSLVLHPASTSHRQLSDDELRAAGVGAGTIRLSVGLESVDDLIWDLDQALHAAGYGEREGREGGAKNAKTDKETAENAENAKGTQRDGVGASGGRPTGTEVTQ
ncbi:MAG TPA: PLP-dependent transferase, partial [Ktedonobacterales bacterium]|nr:PLP-dependent transferase [Ktedonobacterales bacterium]